MYLKVRKRSDQDQWCFSLKHQIEGMKENHSLDRAMLERSLELARYSVSKGSSPIGCVIVDASGKTISEGRNKSGEPWSKTPRRIGDSGFAHAEMDAFYRIKKLEKPEGYTLYSSLEPCLMCGGAMGMIGVGRTVWACDDPWGGSGRLIAWNQHPAFVDIQVVAHPFHDLEREAAELFAPEARRVYPAQGWAAWQERYPEICAAFDKPIGDINTLRNAQKKVRRAARKKT